MTFSLSISRRSALLALVALVACRQTDAPTEPVWGKERPTHGLGLRPLKLPPLVPDHRQKGSEPSVTASLLHSSMMDYQTWRTF